VRKAFGPLYLFPAHPPLRQAIAAEEISGNVLITLLQLKASLPLA
jgi:hypothetical protein